MLVDCLLIALLTAALIWPLFKVKYTTNWFSIESTFIADGRFLKEHWPHPGWQPLWYGGTRFDYIYPPALRYATAWLSKTFPILPVRAYHIYVAFLYCLGIAGVYVLVRLGSNSRRAAWLAAAAAALVSPSYLFMANIRAAGLHIAPWRLTVLEVYGEGPHMSALALLGFALAVCWIAVRDASPRMIALAGVLCALVVSHNFYGATALVIFFAVLCWSLWVTHRENRMWLRAAVIAVLAYGLTAFWLSPSYVRITNANLKLVSEQGNMWSLWIALAVAVAFVMATDKLVRGQRAAAWGVFLSGSVVFFALNVFGQHYFNFRVVGEPTRWIPEFDLAVILLVVEGLRRLWGSQLPQRLLAVRLPRRLEWLKTRNWVPMGLAVVIALGGFAASSRHYLKRPWRLYQREPEYQQRVEFRIPEWISRNLPDSRTLVTGSVRFWYNTWHDLAQSGGGSEQGVLNQMVIPAHWQILPGDQAEPSILWMQCLGVDAVVVHDKTSQEVYHDFQFPKKFAGVLPVLYDDGQGNVIYRVTRRSPGLARVVERARAQALEPYRKEAEMGFIRAYAAVVEQGPDSPATSAWDGPDVLRVRARVKPGEALLVLASYDPAWRAYSGQERLPIRKDVMGQMLIEAPPGEHDLRLVFETPLENRIGRVVSALAALLAVALIVAGRRFRWAVR